MYCSCNSASSVGICVVNCITSSCAIGCSAIHSAPGASCGLPPARESSRGIQQSRMQPARRQRPYFPIIIMCLLELPKQRLITLRHADSERRSALRDKRHRLLHQNARTHPQLTLPLPPMTNNNWQSVVAFTSAIIRAITCADWLTARCRAC